MSTGKDLMLSLTTETMLRYFEKNIKTAVFADAGNTTYKMDDRGGMSAILEQKYKDGWRLIYFASRRLTDVGSR